MCLWAPTIVIFQIDNNTQELIMLYLTYTCGVPQGSTRGPFLFNIYRYINDLPLVTKLQTRLFADDANHSASHYEKNYLEEIVKYELGSISNWMKVNRLSINYNKTKYIVVYN